MERTWLAIELRRHWRSLGALVILVAIVVGAIGAGLAGAVRGLTSLDRLLAVTLPATVVVLPNDPGFDWQAVGRLPEVEAIEQFVISVYDVDDGGNSQGSFPSVDREAYTRAERPVILEGRRLDPTRLDEVMASPNYLASTGKRIGSSVTLTLSTPESIAAAWESGLAEPAMDGPSIKATIVGTVRSSWYTDGNSPDSSTGNILISPAVFQEYAANFVGEPRVGYINALVRLKDGEAGIPAFTRSLDQLTGRTDIDIWNRVEENRADQQTLDFNGWALIALSVAAAIAAAFLLGQAIARYAVTTTSELAPLRSIGLTARGSILMSTLPLLLATVAGALVGMTAAIATSPFFPLGLAAFLEPQPGLTAQWEILGATSIVTVAVLTAIGAGSAWLAISATNLSTRPSVVATAAARLGLAVPVVMGARFALEAGRGRRSVPVRPALIGAIVGVTGVLAALTFSYGLSDASTNPARYGHTYQLDGGVGFQGADAAERESLDQTILADPDVLGINNSYFAVAEVGDKKLTLGTIDPEGRAAAFTLTSGRVPETSTEVAIGPTSAKALGADVGDELALTGPEGSIMAKVVGLVFTPDSFHSNYSNAGFVTPAARSALFGAGFKSHSIQITLRPGSDPTSVASRLAESTAAVSQFGPLPFAPPVIPRPIERLDEVGILPQLLGAFLIVVAIGSLGHALVTAIRRRRHEIAIARALGETPAQARLVSATQASVVVLVGLAIGTPLGIALGRTVWRFVANATPVAFADPASVWTVVAIAPSAIAIALLLAAWPGHRAATLRVPDILRTE